MRTESTEQLTLSKDSLPSNLFFLRAPSQSDVLITIVPQWTTTQQQVGLSEARVFLGRRTQAGIQTAVTGGLCPAFVSRSALVECYCSSSKAVLSSLLCLSSVSADKMCLVYHFAQVVSASSLLSPWLSASLCSVSVGDSFITSLSHVFFLTAVHLVVLYFCLHTKHFLHFVCCVPAVVILEDSHCNLLFLKLEQGTNLIQLSILHA